MPYDMAICFGGICERKIPLHSKTTNTFRWMQYVQRDFKNFSTSFLEKRMICDAKVLNLKMKYLKIL